MQAVKSKIEKSYYNLCIAHPVPNASAWAKNIWTPGTHEMLHFFMTCTCSQLVHSHSRGTQARNAGHVHKSACKQTEAGVLGGPMKRETSTSLWAWVVLITAHHHKHYPLICTWFPGQYFLQRLKSRIGPSSLSSLNKAITDLCDDCTHCYNELLPPSRIL